MTRTIRIVNVKPIGILLPLLAFAAACSDGANSTAAVPNPVAPLSRGPNAPSASPPRASNLSPAPLGSSSGAGSLVFGMAGTWRYEAETGTLSQVSSAPSRITGSGHLLITDSSPRFLIDASGRGTTLRTQASAVLDASLDGSLVAYIDDERRLFIGPPSAPAEYLPDRRFGDLQWSPSGRYLAVAQYAPLDEGTNVVAADLWVIDVSTGASRIVYQPLHDHDGAAVLPYAVAWSSASYVSTISIRSWSPDERYLTVGENLGGGNARGAELPFKMIDVATGAAMNLGCETTLAWKSPHTLAYGCGDDRQLGGWSVLRTWSPEDGVHQITADDETGMNPAWDPTGRYLYFTRSPKSETVIPEDFFAGRGQGNRHIISLDTSTGDRKQLPASMGYADEAVITGTDGGLLVLRRILDPGYSTYYGTPVRAEIWMYAKDGSMSPLLSVPLPSMFPGFQRTVVWTRS